MNYYLGISQAGFSLTVGMGVGDAQGLGSLLPLMASLTLIKVVNLHFLTL